MGTDFFGNNLTENFSTSGVDTHGPYTNDEGPNPQSAILTLGTSTAGVVVTEQTNAIEQIANEISLIIAGPGEFVLQGVNTYSGGTELAGGKLSHDNVFAIGSGTLTFIENATLEATANETLSNATEIDSGVSATFEVTAGNTLTLASVSLILNSASGTATHFGSATDTGTVVLAAGSTAVVGGEGGLAVDGGTLELGSVAAAGVVSLLQGGVTVGSSAARATLDINGKSVTLYNLSGSSAGVITNSGAATTLKTYNTADSTFAGVIQDGASGAGGMSLVIAGSTDHALILTGANTFTGTTTIDSGQWLQIGNGSTSGSIASAVTDEGELIFDRSNAVTYAGALSGGGTLDQIGKGTLTLTGSTAGFTGETMITHGAIVLDNVNALSATGIDLYGDGTALDAAVTTTVSGGLNVLSGDSVTFAAAAGVTLTLASASGQVTDFAGGAGTVVHFGSAADTGTVVLAPGAVPSLDPADAGAVDAGTLRIGDAFGAAIVSNFTGGLTVGSGALAATLDINGNLTGVHNLTGKSTGVITDSGAAAKLLSVSTADSTFSGVIKDGIGVVSLETQGSNGATLTLTGSNTFTGGTKIDSGRLELTTDASAGGGTITFNNNAYATLAFGAGVDLTTPILLTDSTDAIDFAGVSFAVGDHLALQASGIVSAYELETAGGAFLESVNLGGVLGGSTLIAGGDGASGTELAVSLNVFQAGDADTFIENGADRVFVTDTAADIAADVGVFTDLIAAGKVASIFTNNAALSDGSSTVNLTIVGGGNSVSFTGAAGKAVSLYSTAGNADTVIGSNGKVTLTGAQASVFGGGDTIAFVGSGDTVTLSGSAGSLDTVNGSNGTVTVNNGGLATVVGTGDTITVASGGTLSIASGKTLAVNKTESISGALTGAGQLTVAGGSTTIANGSTLTVARLAESGYASTNLSVGTLSYAGALTMSSGTLSLLGTLTLSGANNALTGTINGAGKLSIAGGSTKINAGTALSMASWSISGTANVTLAETVTYAGALGMSGGTLALGAGTLTLTGADTFTGGTVIGAHVLLTSGTAKSVSSLTIGPSAKWQNTTTVNATGTVTIGGSTGTAMLDNAATGIYDLLSNVGLARGTSTTSNITNEGLLEKTGGTGISTIVPGVTNTGTIKVTKGTLDIKGAVIATGADVVVGASVLEFDGAVGSGQSIYFNGNGGTLDLGAPQSFAGAVKGFDIGTTGDAIDMLSGWTFTGATEGATSTTLAFADGSTHVSILLKGDYTGSFSHTAITGGTKITYAA